MGNNLMENFLNPPGEYGLVPFWFWNGTLDPEKLKQQMHMMMEQGIYGAFMHARAYLITPYLEEKWWEAVSVCVEEGRKTGFHPWIYDEYAWPSGTAGSTFEYSYQKPSRVLEKGACNMALQLEYLWLGTDTRDNAERVLAGAEGEPLGFYLVKGQKSDICFRRYQKLSDVPDTCFGSETGDLARLVYFYLKTDRLMADYLNPETIREFINLTHEQYANRFGSDFGSVIPGVFFDEIYMTRGTFVWTPGFEKVFAARHGYDLLEELPWMVMEGTKQAAKVREDYYETAAYLYETAFFSQIGSWCEEHGLMLTGHTEEELAWHPKRQGNFFRTMRHLQIPGADCHDYRYRLPRKISFHEPKYAVSVARAYGKPRAMSEAMGGAGWGCSLQEYRRGLHTLGAMGINMFILHGMYYGCDRQGSQADWPASFFYQNPYWKYFRKFADEARRICYMNTIGQPVVRIGIYYPIREMQRHSVGGSPDPVGKRISRDFHHALYTLIENQMDVDMLDEDTIVQGEIKDGCLLTGGRSVEVLLFPEEGEFIGELERFLERFTAVGGKVVFYSAAATDRLPEVISGWIGRNIEIIEGDAAEVYVNHRRTSREDFYFITNSSDLKKQIKVRLSAEGETSRMNPETGEVSPVPFCRTEEGTVVNLFLAEDEACYLLVQPWEEKAMPSPEQSGFAREPASLFRGKRDVLSYGGYRIITGKWLFLPLSEEYDRRWDDLADRTEMEIPYALFTSPIQEDAEQIRICNTAGEAGYCGRHLSLWNASWITRRPHWQDDTGETDLYFRREIYLEEEVSLAQICVAAVQHFVLYINGRKIREADGMEPVIIEAEGCFRRGENLIAVQVHNPNPYQDSNFAAVDTLPSDRMISLLFEAKLWMGTSGTDVPGRQETIRSDCNWVVSNVYTEKWADIAYHPEASFHHPSWHMRPAENGSWLYAWERGRPPLHPWGELAWFGENIEWPLELNYQITLPVGTDRVYTPRVRGTYRCRIDGRKAVFGEEPYLTFAPVDRVRVLDLTVCARTPQEGLTMPVCVRLAPVAMPYGEWASAGLPWFSGRVLYRNQFWIERDALSGSVQTRYVLRWGQSNSCAEVWVNHRLAGVCAWAPYEADITECIQEGENLISIVIANLAAPSRRHLLVDEGMALGWNRYWNEDNIDRESEDLVSGLMGPVRIYQFVDSRE